MTAVALGAISTKGRAPLPRPAEGFLRRRHHHDGRCMDLRDREPEPARLSPPATPDWALRPLTDPALEVQP